MIRISGLTIGPPPCGVRFPLDEPDSRSPEGTEMRIRLAWVLTILLSVLVAVATAEAQKKTLVIGLNQDPDILDPTLARTYVGRIVFEQMCEKLYEIDEHLTIYPQLAAALPQFSDGGKTVTIKLRTGVKFNDGTPMDAEAVRFSIDRSEERRVGKECRSRGRAGD